MAIISIYDRKSKEENALENKAGKIVDSSLLLQSLGEQRLKSSVQQHVDGLQSNEQQGSDVPQPTIDQENPFSSSVMPTVTDGTTTVPSYNVNDVFKTRIESTDAPVRDAAQDERLKKMSKFNLIAKGLQSVFGGIIGAQGEIVPSPYDGGMTQQLMQNLQGLDDKHFREMAAWRDQELKGQMFNADQQARADQVRLQKMRDDVQNLKDQGRYDDAMKRQAGLDEYEKQQDAKNYTLKKNDQNISNRRLNAQESDDQVRVVQQYTASVNSLQNELKAMKADIDTDPSDIATKQSELDQLTSTRNTLAKQLAENKGFTFEEPAANDISSYQKKAADIMSNYSSGSFSRDQAAKELFGAFKESGTGMSDDEIKERINANLDKRNPQQQQSSQQVAPSRASYNSRAAYEVAKRKHEKSSPQRAETRAVKEKLGMLDDAFGEGLSHMEDVQEMESLQKEFENDPVKATVKAIAKLKSSSNYTKKPDYINTSMGSQPNLTKSSTEKAIEALELKLEDYKKHK